MPPQPPRALLDLPDGRTVEVRVVRQTLVGDRWRCQVEWSEGPGMTYYQGRWAEELRPCPIEGPDDSGLIRVMPGA